MRINIETYLNNSYEEILEDYGEVLERFCLRKTENGNAEIDISCLGDLLSLHKELEKFIEDVEVPLVYFGLMIKSYKDGTPYLEIKDNYD